MRATATAPSNAASSVIGRVKQYVYVLVTYLYRLAAEFVDADRQQHVVEALTRSQEW